MNKAVGLSVLALVAACGGRISTVDDSTGPTSTTTPTPTNVPTSKPNPGREPSPPTPTKPPQPDPGAKVLYSARAYAGGLDHLEINKADYTNDRCTKIHLTHPETSKEFPLIDVPGEWSVQHVQRSAGASACDKDKPGNVIDYGTDGKGTIAWKEELTIFPCTLSAKVVILFDGKPAEESFEVSNVNVIGCK